jgi:mRNA interferase MazF
MNTMKSGKKYNFGDILIAYMQFTDSSEIKARPVLVLFEEFDNIVCAGITSNPHMQGIPLKKDENMIENSIIKLNYIMTISKDSVKKYIFTITEEKKRLVKKEFMNKLM